MKNVFAILMIILTMCVLTFLIVFLLYCHPHLPVVYPIRPIHPILL